MTGAVWRRLFSIGVSTASLIMLMVAAGCAQIPSPAPPKPPVVTLSSCIGDASGATFAQNVHILTSFDFKNNGMTGGNYRTPHAGAALNPSDTPYYQDMQAAFKVAPSYLQTALCNLALNQNPNTAPTGVFIDQDDQAPFAWSFWEVPGQGTGKGRYVAIAEKLWHRTNVLALENVEELILDQLLSPNARGSHGLYSGVTVTAAGEINNPPSPSNLALMAILAREVGLIVYHDFVAATSAAVPPPSLCSDSANKPATFQSFSWNTPGNSLVTPGHIQSLGEETNPTIMSTKNGYPLPSQLRTSSNQYPPPALGSIAAKVALIYNGKNNVADLPDLLADTTPYDDFAETFRLLMLRGNVSSMVVQLVGVNPEPDVMKKLASNSPILGLKVKCIQQQLTKWETP